MARKMPPLAPEARLYAAIEAGRAAGRFTHAYAACGRLGAHEPVWAYRCGSTSASLFDLASLTKALVTTPLFARESLAGRLGPTTTLGSWLGDRGSRIFSRRLLDLPLDALLGHRAGLPDWRSFWIRCASDSAEGACSERERLVARLNALDSEVRPEQGYVYSDVGFILLGLALEERYEQSLSTLFEDLCRNELALAEPPLVFGNHLQGAASAQAIPTGYCALRQRQLVGEVHDENAALLAGVSGHAGLFGSGPGLIDFLTALARSSLGRELLARNAPLRTPGGQLALWGWQQGGGESSACFAAGQALGHLGFTGTAFWLKPEDGAYGILLTNRVISGRLAPWMTEFRRTIFSLFHELLDA